jgi:hypothetical protein
MGSKRRTLVFDADGVIFAYDGWKGADHVGDVDPKAALLLRFLDYLGYTVVISTARENVLPLVEKARISGLVVDQITNRKPVGVAYVDDRGVHHTPTMWKATVEALADVVGDPEILNALEVLGD